MLAGWFSAYFSLECEAPQADGQKYLEARAEVRETGDGHEEDEGLRRCIGRVLHFAPLAAHPRREDDFVRGLDSQGDSSSAISIMLLQVAVTPYFFFVYCRLAASSNIATKFGNMSLMSEME